MIPCDENRNQDYLLGAMTAGEAARLEEHLLGCARCSREIGRLRVLFTGLADLPMPVVPRDLEDAIMNALATRAARGALRERAVRILARPLTAGLAGAAAGLLLALFQKQVLLICGRATGLLLTGWSADLLRGLRGALRDVREITFLVQLVVDIAVKFEPLFRAFGDALLTLPGRASLLSIALSLATALLVGRLVGQIRREKLSHAEH